MEIRVFRLKKKFRLVREIFLENKLYEYIVCGKQKEPKKKRKNLQ